MCYGYSSIFCQFPRAEVLYGGFLRRALFGVRIYNNNSCLWLRPGSDGVNDLNANWRWHWLCQVKPVTKEQMYSWCLQQYSHCRQPGGGAQSPRCEVDINSVKWSLSYIPNTHTQTCHMVLHSVHLKCPAFKLREKSKITLKVETAWLCCQVVMGLILSCWLQALDEAGVQNNGCQLKCTSRKVLLGLYIYKWNKTKYKSCSSQLPASGEFT